MSAGPLVTSILATVRRVLENMSRAERAFVGRRAADAQMSDEGQKAAVRLQRLMGRQGEMAGFFNASRDRIKALLSRSVELEATATAMAEQMEALRADEEALADAVAAVKSNSRAISNLARSARLLAINASVEAARAGQAGAGFAVVAKEMQALSDESAARVEAISTHLDRLDGRLADMDARTGQNEVHLDQLRKAASDMKSVLERAFLRAEEGRDAANEIHAEIAAELDELTNFIHLLGEGGRQTDDAKDVLDENRRLAEAILAELTEAEADVPLRHGSAS
ncbi:MAG: methyl-accepting chemotaxis protein [Pseudomonadota bacterium]